ncbi:hypothetical protein EXIGLDRAFT_765238 [Exidia glandulosa HHB12029]|uniref:F-box domain-containing protein n=1 Tax=Exidia glandulosa HHB12029 TaxID=1314781 RepID=A0A165KMG4_EXIGL|nr:hypothetical protein EXIGLDRAFT_765238 [Exidia glandulosa HHB12029]
MATTTSFRLRRVYDHAPTMQGSPATTAADYEKLPSVFEVLSLTSPCDGWSDEEDSVEWSEADEGEIVDYTEATLEQPRAGVVFTAQSSLQLGLLTSVDGSAATSASDQDQLPSIFDFLRISSPPTADFDEPRGDECELDECPSRGIVDAHAESPERLHADLSVTLPSSHRVDSVLDVDGVARSSHCRGLPNELFYDIVDHLPRRAIIPVAQVCRGFRDYVYGTFWDSVTMINPPPQQATALQTKRRAQRLNAWADYFPDMMRVAYSNVAMLEEVLGRSGTRPLTVNIALINDQADYHDDEFLWNIYCSLSALSVANRIAHVRVLYQDPTEVDELGLLTGASIFSGIQSLSIVQRYDVPGAAFIEDPDLTSPRTSLWRGVQHNVLPALTSLEMFLYGERDMDGVLKACPVLTDIHLHVEHLNAAPDWHNTLALPAQRLLRVRISGVSLATRFKKTLLRAFPLDQQRSMLRIDCRHVGDLWPQLARCFEGGVFPQMTDFVHVVDESAGRHVLTGTNVHGHQRVLTVPIAPGNESKAWRKFYRRLRRVFWRRTESNGTSDVQEAINLVIPRSYRCRPRV